MPEPTSRRLFLSDGANKFQVLSIEQRRDASFYISCPNFARSRWIEIVGDENAKSVNVATAPGEGKLSVHGSGFSGIRAHDSQGHHAIVRGNRLIDRDRTELRPRHLVTVLPEAPHHVPSGTRLSDYVLTAKQIKPTAFILFAIPAVSGLRIKGNIGFHVDDIGVPPDVSFGLMTFPLHGILGVAYSTKTMLQWPPSTHFSHYDGYTVPIFLGGGPKEWRFAAADPTYRLENNELSIDLNFAAPES